MSFVASGWFGAGREICCPSLGHDFDLTVGGESFECGDDHGVAFANSLGSQFAGDASFCESLAGAVVEELQDGGGLVGVGVCFCGWDGERPFAAAVELGWPLALA